MTTIKANIKFRKMVFRKKEPRRFSKILWKGKAEEVKLAIHENCLYMCAVKDEKIVAMCNVCTGEVLS